MGYSDNLPFTGRLTYRFAMPELGPDDLRARLAAVGEHLAAAGERVAIVVVGGAALSLGGHLHRTTEDVDVFARAADPDHPATFVTAQPLPVVLAKAAAKVARDFDMPADWLNAVVSPRVLSDLPKHFADELRWLSFGALRVGVAGRSTLVALKLHAAADRDRHSVHVQDLLALRPTDGELTAARAWVVRQDIGPGFPHLVDDVLAHIRRIRDGGH
jgi:hypothetical protein